VAVEGEGKGISPRRTLLPDAAAAVIGKPKTKVMLENVVLDQNWHAGGARVGAEVVR
jgi:hypothetical protein